MCLSNMIILICSTTQLAGEKSTQTSEQRFFCGVSWNIKKQGRKTIHHHHIIKALYNILTVPYNTTNN